MFARDAFPKLIDEREPLFDAQLIDSETLEDCSHVATLHRTSPSEQSFAKDFVNRRAGMNLFPCLC